MASHGAVESAPGVGGHDEPLLEGQQRPASHCQRVPHQPGELQQAGVLLVHSVRQTEPRAARLGVHWVAGVHCVEQLARQWVFIVSNSWSVRVTTPPPLRAPRRSSGRWRVPRAHSAAGWPGTLAGAPAFSPVEPEK